MPFPNTPSGRANQAQGVVIADMDGAGLPDLVVSASDIGGTRTGGVVVFRSTGSRTFAPGTTYPTTFFRNGMGAVGDLNGDGHPDVVVTGATSGDSLAYFLNDGSGGLGAPVYIPHTGAVGLALGDLTRSGPGTLDVVVGTGGSGTWMLRNGPNGAPPSRGGHHAARHHRPGEHHRRSHQRGRRSGELHRDGRRITRWFRSR
ncbi:MAG: VCBS repeat-containing protein [Verrucomicrobia bacterium]|nr:VCBS repeat-containing protein [Verrucomicrobiota bacterium]